MPTGGWERSRLIRARRPRCISSFGSSPRSCEGASVRRSRSRSWRPSTAARITGREMRSLRTRRFPAGCRRSPWSRARRSTCTREAPWTTGREQPRATAARRGAKPARAGGTCRPRRGDRHARVPPRDRVRPDARRAPEVRRRDHGRANPHTAPATASDSDGHGDRDVSLTAANNRGPGGAPQPTTRCQRTAGTGTCGTRLRAERQTTSPVSRRGARGVIARASPRG
jgi:hypothetical protein